MKFEPPNSLIYLFRGSLQVGDQTYLLNQKNLLLRGSILKNTEFIIGIICFVGHNTKIMQNSTKSRKKLSLLES